MKIKHDKLFFKNKNKIKPRIPCQCLESFYAKNNSSRDNRYDLFSLPNTHVKLHVTMTRIPINFRFLTMLLELFLLYFPNIVILKICIRSNLKSKQFSCHKHFIISQEFSYFILSFIVLLYLISIR